jgi:hypothetical protein
MILRTLERAGFVLRFGRRRPAPLRRRGDGRGQEEERGPAGGARKEEIR